MDDLIEATKATEAAELLGCSKFNVARLAQVATYSNGRTVKVGDEVTSAHGTTKYIAVIDTFTNAVGYLGYWASAGKVTDVLPDGTVVVFRDEVGFNDPTGHRYAVAAKHLLVAGDS